MSGVGARLALMHEGVRLPTCRTGAAIYYLTKEQEKEQDKLQDATVERAPVAAEEVQTPIPAQRGWHILPLLPLPTLHTPTPVRSRALCAPTRGARAAPLC